MKHKHTRIVKEIPGGSATSERNQPEEEEVESEIVKPPIKIEERRKSTAMPELDKEVEEQLVLENGNNNFPAIWSEEGKYLASVLGDALVKGLSLVSQERPVDPVEYLANFLRTYKEDENGELVEVDEAVLAPLIGPIPSAGQGRVEPEERKEEVKEPEIAKEKVKKVEEEPKAKEEKQVVPSAKEKVVEAQVEPDPEAKGEEIPKEVPAPPQPQPTSESSLNNQLDEGYDKLEDALDEEEATTDPFDPEKEELAEKALIEASRIGDHADDGDGGGALPMQSSTRDENGQSVLHFACTRPGGGSTIMAFLQNPSVNLAWRDVNLRTARDIAENLKRSENTRVVDNWVMILAQRGDLETLEGLMIDGYDHLADVEESNGTHIIELAENAGHREVSLLLRSVPEFREKVERVHRCVRSGDADGLKSLVGEDRRVAFAMSPRTGRNAMHVAVLCEEVGIVKWLGEMVPECVKRGDNLERTCLHYAMGVDKVEKIVRVLVRAGAKRVVKDLRDRQPSWYFINRDEIGQLQAEERAILT